MPPIYHSSADDETTFLVHQGPNDFQFDEPFCPQLGWISVSQTSYDLCQVPRRRLHSTPQTGRMENVRMKMSRLETDMVIMFLLHGGGERFQAPGFRTPRFTSNHIKKSLLDQPKVSLPLPENRNIKSITPRSKGRTRHQRRRCSEAFLLPVCHACSMQQT